MEVSANPHKHFPERAWLRLSLLQYGAVGLALQVFLLRRLLATFGGNELSLAFGLALWLMGCGFGSWLSGLLGERLTLDKALCAMCFFLAFLLPVCSLWSPSIVRLWTGRFIGEVYSPIEIMWGAALLTGVPCVMWGAVFPILCRRSSRHGFAPGWVFLHEAFGAGIGGLVYTFLLLPVMGDWGIALLLAGAVVALWLMLLAAVPKFRGRATISLAIAQVVLLFCLVVFGASLKESCLKANWRGMTVLESKDSLYGSLVVTEREGQISFFENGSILCSFPDDESYEDVVHVPLLQHPNPKNLLLIGGGPSAIAEARQHPLEEIHYLELDSALIELIEHHARSGEQSVLDDSRITLTFGDARRQMKRLGQRFDVVVVCMGDPTTLQTNRLFTVEFFREVRRCLRPGGVFALEVSSAENLFSEELTRYLQLLNDTLSSVWTEVLGIPGLQCLFLASDSQDSFVRDIATLYRRQEQRGVSTDYLFYTHLPVRFDWSRMQLLDALFQSTRQPHLNRDLHPLGFYHAMLLWSKQTQKNLSRALMFLLKHRERFLALVAAVVLFMGFVVKVSGRCSVRVMLLAAGFGLCEMGFSVLLILAFSAQLGYVYSRIGLLSTAFMFGTGMGVWGVARTQLGSREASVSLTRNGALFAALLVMTPVAVFAGAAVLPRILFEMVFYCLSFCAGLLGGKVFPLALRSLESDAHQDKRSHAGLLYGADLLGSALGAFGVSLFLLPLGGIWVVSVGMAGVLVICVWVQRA